MWRQQYERILRLRDKAQKNKTVIRSYALPYTFPREESIDDILTCIQHIHHLKDWLVSCGDMTSKEAHTFIDENPELIICQDLCNGTKHLTTKFREQKLNLTNKLKGIRPTEKDRHADGEYIQIIHIDGKEYEAMKLVEKAIVIWQEKLKFMDLL